MSSLLRRIAVFSARHRALVIGAWLVVLIAVGFASHTLGTQYSSSAEVAGSDSAAANEIMARIAIDDLDHLDDQAQDIRADAPEVEQAFWDGFDSGLTTT